MSRYISFLLAATVIVGFDLPAMAVHEGLMRDLAKVLKHPDLTQDQAVFDGEKFLVPEDAALEFSNRYTNRLNEAYGVWNRMSPSDRGAPELAELREELDRKGAYSDGMAKVFAALAKKSKAEEVAAATACVEFRAKVINADRDRKDIFARLITMVEYDYKKDDVESAEGLAAHAAALDVIDRECADPANKVFVREDLCRHNNQPVDDPFLVCKVAGKKRRILEAFINNLGERLAGVAGGLDASLITRKDARMYPFEAGKTYEELTQLTEAKKARYLEPLLPLFKAVGIEAPDPQPVWDRMATRAAEMKAAIDTHAAETHGLPETGSSYSVALAKKAMRDYYPTAKFIKAGFGNDWEVKMRGAVPLYRDGTGYMLLQVPGEPWCIGSTYWFKEDYVGKRYQPAKAIRMGKVRWQQCK